MDVFQSLGQMVFVLLLYVSCHYTETLQLITNKLLTGCDT